MNAWLFCIKFQVKDLIVKQRYRKDLTKVAMQRAAAIVRSQKALPVKKAAAKKSEWKVYDMIHKKNNNKGWWIVFKK